MKKFRFGLVLLAVLALMGTKVFAGGGQQSGPTASAGGEIDLIRIGVIAMPTNGDPTVSVGNANTRVNYNVHDTLIYYDYKDNGTLKPMIAESWERIDGRTVEFRLRRDVLFHNGDRLTSADVKFSFDRLKQNISGTTLAASCMETIERVDIIDDYTCRVVTSVIDPLLESRLAAGHWGSVILPKDYIERVGQDEFRLNPVGTGPYKWVSRTPNQIVLERFDDYYGEKAPVRRAEFYVYAEVAPRITALATGELDIIGEVPIDQIATVENMGGVRVEKFLIQNYHVLSYNTNHPVMSDRRLRQALNLGINRELLVQTLWHGDAVVPRGHQYVEFGDLYFPDYPMPQYNPQRARQLLAESSYNGELITYRVTSYTFAREAAEAIVDMWRQIGVNAQVVNVQSTNEDVLVVTWSNSMRFTDPAGGLWLLWGPPEAGSSFGTMGRWQMTPEYIRTGQEMLPTMDRTRRAQLARRLMEIADEEVPFSLLYQPIDAFGISNRINWTPTNFHAINLRAGNISLR